MAGSCIVVGGGVAGLTTATRLAKEGWKVELFERRPSLGGRAGGYRDPETGDVLDVGPHLLAGCYFETKRYLRRVGAENQFNLPEQLSVPYVHPGGRISTLSGGGWPAPLHLLRGILCFNALSWRSRLRVLRIGASLIHTRLSGTERLRGVAATTWLREIGQDEEAIRVLWEPLILACLNTPPHRASAELFARVAVPLFLGGRRSAALGTGSLGLEALFGKSGQQYLEQNGGLVHKRTAVRSIRIHAGRVEGIEVSGDIFRTADAYVLAAPPPAVLAMLPPETATREPFRVLTEFRPSAICSLYIWPDRPITPLPYAHLRTRRFEWIFNMEELMADATFSGPVYGLENSAADWMMPWSKQEMLDAAIEDIETCFPEARGVRIRHASVSKVRDATFRAVPELDGRRPSVETAVDGLFLAGDWTDTGYPGTIEGAAVSGHRCAAAVLRRGGSTTVDRA